MHYSGYQVSYRSHQEDLKQKVVHLTMKKKKSPGRDSNVALITTACLWLCLNDRDNKVKLWIFNRQCPHLCTHCPAVSFQSAAMATVSACWLGDSGVCIRYEDCQQWSEPRHIHSAGDDRLSSSVPALPGDKLNYILNYTYRRACNIT